MTLSSFDLENQFDSMVVCPAAAKKTISPRKVFAPGLHGCPHCQAQALYQAGFEELGRRLMDASSLRALTSEPIEVIKRRLWQLNLYKEGALRPDLSTSYVSQSIVDGLISREQHYRHGALPPGQARPCDANQFHDHVARLISENIAKAMRTAHPDTEISLCLDKPLHPSRRRPDIQVHARVPGRPLQVFAIELQLSSISEEKFSARHRELDSLADSVVWVLKKKSLRLREVARRLFSEGYKAYWFEKGEDDSTYKIWPVTGSELTEANNVQRKENSTPSVCTRTEQENSKQTPETHARAEVEVRSDFEVRGHIDLLSPTAIPVTRNGRTFFTTAESSAIAREIRRLNRIIEGVATERERIEGRQEPMLSRRAERQRKWATRIDRIAQNSRTESDRIYNRLQPIRDGRQQRIELAHSQEIDLLRSDLDRLDRLRKHALERQEQVQRIRAERRQKKRNAALWEERRAAWAAVAQHWQDAVREVLSQQTISMKIAQSEGTPVSDARSLIQFWRSQDREIAEAYYCKECKISSLELFLSDDDSRKFDDFLAKWESNAMDRYRDASKSSLSVRLKKYRKYLYGRPAATSSKEKIERAIERIKLGLSLSASEINDWNPQLESFIKKRPIRNESLIFGHYPPPIPSQLKEMIDAQKLL